MRVLGAIVPFSNWTLVALFVGWTVGLLLTRPLAVRTGWALWPTRVALLGLVANLALTLTPTPRSGRQGLQQCLTDSFAQFGYDLFHTGGGIGGNFLNMLLPLPWLLAAVVATRRVVPVALVAVALPLVIELAQSQIHGRLCSPTDWLTNSIGGLIGVAIGAGWLALQRRRLSDPVARR